MWPHWLLRKLLKRLALLLGLPVMECCDRCGVRQPLIWHAPDDLWTEVTAHTEGGVFCPKCFDRLAYRKGIRLRWLVRRD